MKKKGQVTFYILLIVILLTIILMYLIPNSNDAEGKVKQALLNSNTKNVKQVNLYIEKCLNDNLEDIIKYISLKGGYLLIPRFYLEQNWLVPNKKFYIPYYLYADRDESVSIKDIQDRIALGVKMKLEECSGLTNLPSDLNIDITNAEISVILNNEEAILNAEIPITIKSGKDTTNIKDFTVSHKTNLNILLNTARDITMTQVSFNDSLCMTCLKEISKYHGVHINIKEIQENNSTSLIYMLNQPEESELEFYFAHRFNYYNETMKSREVVGEAKIVPV